MGLVKKEVIKTYSCDECGKVESWSESWRSKTVFHKKQMWEEDVTVCSEDCAIRFDLGHKNTPTNSNTV